MQNKKSLGIVNEKEAARMLGWSVKTLRNRRWLRQAPRYLKMGRTLRYKVADLEAFLEKCAVEPCSDRHYVINFMVCIHSGCCHERSRKG